MLTKRTRLAAVLLIYIHAKIELLHLRIYESNSGGGEAPAGLDLSSGKGMYSKLSLGGKMMRRCFQSSFACSMRS